jgi:two-component system, OmpR family, manganese sensing sensor histidine kinase
MFERLRWQLLFSYLGVFAVNLGVFAIAVRLVFGYSLRQSLSNELIVLAKVAATHAEIQNDRLIISDEFTNSQIALLDRKFEWFDLHKQLVGKAGNLNIELKLDLKDPIQFNKNRGYIPEETISVVIPIINNDNQQQIGYIRIIQSLDSLDRTFHQLDIGLVSGMLISLIISGGAGIYLTSRAMKPAKIGYQKLQQFTADAAHELRNSLMAVKTNAGTALKYPDGMRSGDLKKFNAIASATEQIIILTEDLLILARGDSDRYIDLEPVNLTLLLQTIVAKYPTFEANIQPNSWVYGSANSLDRVFANLIENAVHYTPADGKIEIVTQVIDRQIEIAIIDDGIGIATADLDRVFDRFWRGDRSRTRWKGGAGLGLAIARSIVEQHRGSISVKSELGIGSQFIVRLPVAGG